MLILQRHAGQSIWINKEIRIIVLGHFRGVTHIGVEAPPETKITQGEIKEKGAEPEHD